MTLWEIEIHHHSGRGDEEAISFRDPEHVHALAQAKELEPLLQKVTGQAAGKFTSSRGFLLQGKLTLEEVERFARSLLTDPVTEYFDVHASPRTLPAETITITRKPGVMDPVADTAKMSARLFNLAPDDVRTFKRYTFGTDTTPEFRLLLARKAFANEAIDQIISGTFPLADHFRTVPYEFVKITVPIRELDDAGLEKLSKEGQLYLNLSEMRAIRDHFKKLGRNPTDIELETIAQTWSEHCSHKTLRGPYEHQGVARQSGLLRDTIMHVTKTLDRDWCVSVFTDNAGVIKFNDEWNLCFKVETHNHPSAIEPYGGANTGLGGVIRDPLGTGMGAKPICNTDVFCVAPPQIPYESLPEGVLHPKRVLEGIVAGVRDYGNRMGIPTVNGALCFDDRYLGNPLVYCGTVGLLPANKCFGSARAGDLIVAVGGRTGRDGIHGATFSSGELTSESETVSSGAVQIGNPIQEKKLVDILLQARDQNLYRAITDCGAGGFSSAVGEMGETIGAFVQLEKAPLKYQGLSYTEIWISEAQERMVLAVPPESWESLRLLCKSEDVEAVVLGRFESTNRLTLTFHHEVVGELDMHFLHRGRPAVVTKSEWVAVPVTPHFLPSHAVSLTPGEILRKLLGSLNVASKEWVIRQYDHEVQSRTVIRPFVGVAHDGPSDCAVLTPILGDTQGIAVGCGINTRLGDLDPYQMAANAIDEAVRNVVASGADPDRIALLDNFCWGNTARPEVFGSLAEAAFACRDVALALGTPFISGKDSLNNEFLAEGKRIVIPPTLLISAIGIVPDVTRAVTMDLKEVGNRIAIIGLTRAELAGSELNLVLGGSGGNVPKVDPPTALAIFRRLHEAISKGLIRSSHDLSEGGLAVAIAEMAFTGELGVSIDLSQVPCEGAISNFEKLFAESPTRFLIEVEPSQTSPFERLFGELPFAWLGEVTAGNRLEISSKGTLLLSENIAELKSVWKAPLDW